MSEPGLDRLTAWLAGSRLDHARFTATNERFGRTPVYGLVLGGCTAAAAPTYGSLLLVLVALASLTVVTGKLLQRRARSPELVVAVTFLLLMANVAVSVLVTGGPHSPLLALAVVPVFTQAVFFRPAVTLVWTLVAALLVLAGVAGAMVLPQVAPAPGLLLVLVFLSLLACMGPAARHLADSDTTARDSAAHDPLTGLPNRRALADHFAHAQQQAQATGAFAPASQTVGLMVVDVDHFKAVNDTHGHERGDQVLVEIARRLSAAVRTGDSVHRVGGEEFVVLAPEAGPAECAAVAERLRTAVRAHPVHGLAVTVSVGTCCAPTGSADLETLSRFADRALYQAKHTGRDRVCAAGDDPRA